MTDVQHNLTALQMQHHLFVIVTHHLYLSTTGLYTFQALPAASMQIRTGGRSRLNGVTAEAAAAVSMLLMLSMYASTVLCLQTALAVALQGVGGHGFDKLTKTTTVAKLLQVRLQLPYI